MFIAEQSFLRHLPAALDAKQQIQIDAFVYSCDAIFYDYNAIKVIAANYGKNVINISRIDRTALFAHAWSIVNQVHTVRQLLQIIYGELKNESKAGIFYKKYECAWALRNKINHLKTNIDNLTKKKSISAPIFGAFTYLYAEQSQCKNINNEIILTGATSVSITAGYTPNQHPLVIFAVPNQNINMPVSHFKLFAFDITLEIETMINDLLPIIASLEKNSEAAIKVEAQKKATEETPLENLLSSYRGDFVMLLDIAFGETEVEA